MFKKKDSENEAKDKILRDLRSSFPSIRRPNNDDTMFEILFDINKQFCTLRIFVLEGFPTSRPVLQVVGNVSHPWLDSYKRVVGCEKVSIIELSSGYYIYCMLMLPTSVYSYCSY